MDALARVASDHPAEERNAVVRAARQAAEPTHMLAVVGAGTAAIGDVDATVTRPFAPADLVRAAVRLLPRREGARRLTT